MSDIDPASLSKLMLLNEDEDGLALAKTLADAPLLQGLPFAKALGMRLISSGDGQAVLAIPYQEALIGDPETGVIHGGVVTSLLDTCGGVAVMASRTRPASAATLDLRIDYMRPAAPGAPLFAKAHCYRETRLVTFVSAVAYQADAADAPIATAVGAFMVDGRKAPDEKSGAAAKSTPSAAPRGDVA